MSKFISIFGSILIFVLSITVGSFILAEENAEKQKNAIDIKTIDIEVDPPLAIEQLNEQEAFIKRLSEELTISKNEYRQLSLNVADTENRIESLDSSGKLNEKQLEFLDLQTELNERDLAIVSAKINETEIQINIIEEDLENYQEYLDEQSKLLIAYLKELYKVENKFLFYEDNGDLNAFKLLLSENSLSENLEELNYLELLHQAGKAVADEIEKTSEIMKESQFELEAKKGSLIRLQAKQIEQENKISLQKEAKNRLVKINEDQIKLYKELYEEEKRQQETLAEEIKAINNVLKIAKLKYYEEGEQFVVAELEEMLNGYERRAQNIDFSVLENLSIHSLKWPSDTALGMSAYFRYAADGYEKIFGVRHNAIDIPLYQGSQIRAAADGIVHTVKDNGYGYSYISVVHAGGFMTNYGHLSKMLVEVGDVVKSGDIIALSGGMPGTPGAGYMTTGPHLHFEVLRNGVYVDPLNYLPLNVLTEEQAEELPEKYQDDWKADVLRSQRIKRHLENEQESAN